MHRKLSAMTTALIVLIVLALVGYGLEHNHSRHREPRARLAGSFDVVDRDLSRVAADLRIAADHEPTPLARRRGRAIHLRRHSGVRI